MMATQLADAAVLAQESAQGPEGHRGTRFDSHQMPDDDRLNVARGIVTAVLMAAPFWALVAFTVFMLR